MRKYEAKSDVELSIELIEISKGRNAIANHKAWSYQLRREAIESLIKRRDEINKVLQSRQGQRNRLLTIGDKTAVINHEFQSHDLTKSALKMKSELEVITAEKTVSKSEHNKPPQKGPKAKQESYPLAKMSRATKEKLYPLIKADAAKIYDRQKVIWGKAYTILSRQSASKYRKYLKGKCLTAGQIKGVCTNATQVLKSVE
jgi:hypothetical protein